MIVNNGTLYDRLVLCLVALFNVVMVWLSLGTGLGFGGEFWLFGLGGLVCLLFWAAV